MTSRIRYKQAAKEQIKGKMPELIICLLLAFVILCAVSVTGIGAIIFGAVFVISFARIYLKITDGFAPEARDIFSGFDVIGKAIWLEIIMSVFIFLWTLLLFVPGIIKSLSYSMSYFILAENPEMTAREALNESKIRMRGHKGELFVMMLSFIPWFLLGSVTFGIALLYVVPYVYTTVANFYKDL